MIFKLQDKLVEKEYLNAKTYYDLGSYFYNCSFGGNNYEACIITAENAMRDYPYSKRREDFAIMLLRAKYLLATHSVEARKQERMDAAKEEYYAFWSYQIFGRDMGPIQELFPNVPAWIRSGAIDQYSNGFCICPACSGR